MLQIHTNSATFFPGGQLIHKTSNSCNRVSPKHLPPNNSSPQKTPCNNYAEQKGRKNHSLALLQNKKKTKTTKKSQQTPHPPKKKCLFFYLSNWTLCVSQDVAAQAGNSALVSLAWSDHPAGEVGRFPMTYHVFWEVDKLICFFLVGVGWLATQLS